MFGIICSIVAGVCMSLQGVFNTRLGEKIGQWETNIWVQGSGLLITFVVLLLVGNGNFKNIKNSNKVYLLGGVLGAIIIFTVMQGIKNLGPTYSIATILIAQLIAAAVIDFFGFFGTDKMPFQFSKLIGLSIMIFGVIVFKWKG